MTSICSSSLSSVYESPKISDEGYCKLADYVESHFQIVADNFKNDDPLWLKLKSARVILLGESHNIVEERKVFAYVIKHIWNPEKDVLLIEHEPRLDFGQLKYMPTEIAQHAGCWDVSDQEKNEMPSMKYARQAVGITQYITKMRDTTDPEQFHARFSKLFQWMKKYVQADTFAILEAKFTFYQQCPPAELKRARLNLLITTYPCAIDLVSSLLNAGKTNYNKKERAYRDLKFTEEVFKCLENKKRVIAISGAGHIMPRRRLVETLKTYVPFLSLIGNSAYNEKLGSKAHTCSAREKRKEILKFRGRLPSLLAYNRRFIVDVLENDLNQLKQEADTVKQKSQEALTQT